MFTIYLTSFSWLLNHAEKRDLIRKISSMTSQTGKQTIAIHILPSILRHLLLPHIKLFLKKKQK